MHSTALRWKAVPKDAAEARQAFEVAASTWEPLDITVPSARAVFEDIPYMHIPDDEARIWWVSEPVPS